MPSGSSMPSIVLHLLSGELVVVRLAQVFDEVSGIQTNPALTLALFYAHWLESFQGGVLCLGLEHSSHLASVLFYLALPQTAAA